MGSGRRGELLGVAEVADYLGVGMVTVYRWCREGRLPCLKVGKSSSASGGGRGRTS